MEINDEKNFTYVGDGYICDKETGERVARYEDDFEPDAHSCRANASSYGVCTVCGAIVSGTLADYELHGYDPLGTA